MKSCLKRVVLVLPVLFITGAALVGQQPPSTPLSVQNIKGPLYFVKGGSGANTGFYIAAREVVVIDAKMSAASARQMLDEIKKITPKPVTTILLTHSDGDHVNGLNGFPAGLKIIAQENCRREMETAFKQPNAASLLPYLPNQTFTDKLDLKLGTSVIQFVYFGPAHTSGDAIVYFPAEKVAFVGDLVFLGRDPLIHTEKGGTSLGYIHLLKKILELDADVFLSGHNDPLTKTDIRGLLTSLEDKTAKIADMVKQGKTLDEVKAAFGVQAMPGQPAGRRWPSVVEVIYQDLIKKK
jgi:cyclase